MISTFYAYFDTIFIVSSEYPLTKQEFDEIYSKVPRLTVEVLLYNEEKGVFLTQRNIEPYKNAWHLPGGTVYLGESLLDAVKRVAAKELSVDVEEARNVGYIEYPEHYKDGHGSPIGIVFKVTSYAGIPQIDSEASDGQWFKELPSNMHPSQDDYLINAGFLKKRLVIPVQ
jgi:ADP-ribose pyrophosphatase YjhB (NUDIX family)